MCAITISSCIQIICLWRWSSTHALAQNDANAIGMPYARHIIIGSRYILSGSKWNRTASTLLIDRFAQTVVVLNDLVHSKYAYAGRSTGILIHFAHVELQSHSAGLWFKCSVFSLLIHKLLGRFHLRHLIILVLQNAQLNRTMHASKFNRQQDVAHCEHTNRPTVPQKWQRARSHKEHTKRSSKWSDDKRKINNDHLIGIIYVSRTWWI